MDKTEKLFLFLKEQAKVPLLPDEIALMLEVPEDCRAELTDALCTLESCGMVTRTKRGRYAAAEGKFVSGKYSRHDGGFGFVLNAAGDVYIPPTDAGGAMNGDDVVALCLKTPKGKKPEGRIIKITKRATETVVGVYKNGTIYPDNRKIGNVLTADNPDASYEGQRVVVKIKNYDTLLCEVIVTLGSAESNDAQMKGIMYEYSIPDEFAPEVEEAAERVAETLSGEIEGRRDLRAVLTVTIDGRDARDLDDAISLEKLEGGNSRLYVHIADVSHFVKYKSVIDSEALSRGTSCYLPDRVSPMLPRVLSNGVCSLNPNEDKLALTTIMDIDSNGRIADYEVTESVIKSDYRLNYDDVTLMLEDNENPLWEKYANIREMLCSMRELSEILRKKRFRDGSIEFNIPEAKVLVDENGKACEIKLEEHTVSHEIIEEFMLSCNRTLAEYAFNLSLPFVYRVHEEPLRDKVREVLRFASDLGYKTGGKITGKKINDLLTEIRGQRGERVINTLMLRAQMKARYSEENEGHFGLGATYYCHFTSPIRRYPDLWCHRMIKAVLHGENYYKFERDTHSVARKSSEREELAAFAERDATKLKMCEYMERHMGEEFDGVVSSVTSFGYFVELDNTVEGLVHVTDMNDDYYVYDEKELKLRGERGGSEIRIGDRAKVRVAAVDSGALRIDFVPGGRK